MDKKEIYSLEKGEGTSFVLNKQEKKDYNSRDTSNDALQETKIKKLEMRILQLEKQLIQSENKNKTTARKVDELVRKINQMNNTINEMEQYIPLWKL